MRATDTHRLTTRIEYQQGPLVGNSLFSLLLYYTYRWVSLSSLNGAEKWYTVTKMGTRAEMPRYSEPGPYYPKSGNLLCVFSKE